MDKKIKESLKKFRLSFYIKLFKLYFCFLKFPYERYKNLTMDDIQKALQSRRNIHLNHLNLAIGNDIQKGKVAQEGEVREWGGKKYKKQGGEWKEIVEGKESKKDNQTSKDSKKEENKSKVDLGDTEGKSDDRINTEERLKRAKRAMNDALANGDEEKAAHAKAAMEGYGMQLKKMNSEEKKQKNAEKEQIKNEIKEELKKEMNSPLKPQEGKTYEINKRGKGETAEFIIEATDGSHQVEMTFDTEKDAKEFAEKKKFILSNSFNLNDIDEDSLMDFANLPFLEDATDEELKDDWESSPEKVKAAQELKKKGVKLGKMFDWRQSDEADDYVAKKEKQGYTVVQFSGGTDQLLHALYKEKSKNK